MVRIRSGAQDIDAQAYLKSALELARSGRDFDREAHQYRIDDMRRVINTMLSSEIFGKLIDSKKIAVGGHSLGGFTAMSLCIVNQDSYDDRVKAVLLFSPGVFMFTEEELAAVKVPSMYMIGEKERDTSRADTTIAGLAEMAFKNLPSPKYFLEIKRGTHFSFNNHFSTRLRSRLFSGTKKQFEVINKYAIAFLERHVAGSPAIVRQGGRRAGKEGIEKVLEERDPMLTEYWKK